MDELDANYNTIILLKRILNIYVSSCKLDTCDLLWGSVTGTTRYVLNFLVPFRQGIM